MTATILERGTKPFITLSLLVLGALTVTTAIDWPSLQWVSLIALVGSFLAAGGSAPPSSSSRVG